ncbi:efflux transporter outer membrane subunit [Defluviimonas sp. WL0075]|uniref:Efflux transporter outer membrane subunit n=1 Tax=Albidovulum sediminicola TaxID=2984331 RepID=A0ABT2Z6G7_9RHOB|nr:efflux transporter outer membrane subunit [Defluviimonas sp. WL0075]MCV2866666.1 efflux transporter outer membrane subunit [Defluviimonas sp. WL0075]
MARFQRNFPILLISSCLALSACSNGQAQRLATLNLPFLTPVSAIPAPDLSHDAWWTGFRDPVLDDLIRRGLQQNLSIREARERVIAADAIARSAGTVVSGDANAGLTRADQAGDAPVNERRFDLGASWLLDFFGRARSERENSRQSAEARRADADNAALAFLGQLATAYIDLRFYETGIRLKTRDLASRRKTLEQTEALVRLGNATELDLAQARALLNTTQSEIPVLEARARAQQNRIATLLAVPAGTLSLVAAGEQPAPRGGIPASITANLVRGRPDVRSAEHSYAAAVARIGVAEAELYPSIRLGGSITASNSAGVDTSGWSFGPTLTVPIFNRGRLYANVDAAESGAREAHLAWQRTVLEGVNDVQSALYALQKYNAAAGAAAGAVDQYTKSLDLSRTLAERGNITTLDLIDAERQISDARETLSEARRQVALQYVLLNVALGAGFAAGQPPAMASAVGEGPAN